MGRPEPVHACLHSDISGCGADAAEGMVHVEGVRHVHRHAGASCRQYVFIVMQSTKAANKLLRNLTNAASALQTVATSHYTRLDGLTTTTGSSTTWAGVHTMRGLDRVDISG
eukprot:766475-Hanusia_phi.AAC.2